MTADGDCVDCPDGATCVEGSTLETMEIEPAFFRFSLESTELYPTDALSCPGSAFFANSTNRSNFGADLCAEGYEGPLCSRCR